MTPSDEPGIEPMEVWNGVFHDRREVRLRDSGITVTHRLRATCSTSVRFQVIDPLPAEFDIEDIGFHPEFEPAHGRVDAGQAVISGVAEPEEELVVKYGLLPQRQHGQASVEARQRSTKPSIELATKVEGTEPDDVDLESAAMTRSSSEEGPSSAGPDDGFADISRRIEDKEAAAWGPDTADHDGPDEDTAEPTSQTETEPDEADATAVPDEPFSINDLFEGDAGTSPEESQEQPPRPGGQGGDPFGDSEIDASFFASMAASKDEEAEAEGDEADTATDSATTDNDEVVETLIDQLQTDRITDEQRRRLGEQLRHVLQETERDQRSTDVRLHHLESQLQRFAAYADAMEAVIDEHGPAEAFLSEVREDITAVESMVDGLEHDMDAASNARHGQRKRLNVLDDEVATLDSRLERLRDRLESLRSNHRRKTADLDERLTEVEPVGQHVDDLETDVATLQETVERLEARLKAVGDALAAGEPE